MTETIDLYARDGEAALEKSLRIIEDRNSSLFIKNLSGFSAILNDKRQIVYSNQSEDFPDIFGQRPGEFLNCVNAGLCEGGCGTSEQCRHCGALCAILTSLETDSPSTRECSLTWYSEGRRQTSEFRVASVPFQMETIPFLFVTFEDVTDSKRKLALERIFFHDLLNTASSLSINIDLMRRFNTESEMGRLIDNLDHVAKSLVDEIISQKILTQAENGTLEVRKDLMSSTEVLQRVIRILERQDCAEGKRLEIDPDAAAFSIISDSAIIERIVINLTKNALEASKPGQKVILDIQPHETRFEIIVRNAAVIPDAMRARIFERSFSTKGADRGLGTYSVKLLTEDYLKGRVGFSSDAEHGTVFRVSVPVPEPNLA